MHLWMVLGALGLSACGGGEPDTAPPDRDGAPAAEAPPFAIPSIDVTDLEEGSWTSGATDPSGDGANPALADGAEVRYRVASDTLWVRIELHALPDPDVFGVNLVLDVDGDPGNGSAWWGANDQFMYDRLVTAWVTRSGDGWNGTIGVGDADARSAGDWTNVVQNEVALGVDPSGPIVYLGVPMAHLGGEQAVSDGRMVVAVGSNQSWNDDIPDEGAIVIGGEG